MGGSPLYRQPNSPGQPVGWAVGPPCRRKRALTADANAGISTPVRRDTATALRLDNHDGAAAAALCGHDLRRDVGAGRAHRRGEPWPGLPRRGRPARDAQGRRERDRRGRQPVPARAWHRAAARGDRRAAQAATSAPSTTRTPRCWSPSAPPRPSPSAVLGLVEPGSEVLLIEPFYDSYSPVIAMAGCQRRAVPLVPDGRGFAIDVDGLRSAVTAKTKALIVNSPHNPTGMVASDDGARQRMAELAVDADLLVITDEVYEHLVFDGRPPPPAGQLSRDGRAHGHDLQRGQDVQLSPAGRSDGLAAQPNSSRACGRPSSTCPMSAARRSSPRWPTRSTPRRRGWPRCGSRCRPSATGWVPRWHESGLRGARQLRHLLSVRRSAAARL